MTSLAPPTTKLPERPAFVLTRIHRLAQSIRRLLPKFLAVLSIIALTMIAYLLWARPSQLRWGATDEEVQRTMPGDELHANPTFLATRAITIEGSPEAIWPWLVQMSYSRAGFYGYDIMENLGSPEGIRSADHIMPEFQQFTVGDEVPISAVSRMTFYAIEPDQYLIWTGEGNEGGFTWALYPIDAQHTRLVSRIGWSHHWSQPSVLAFDLFTEFTDHLAVRKILQGVQDRVEGRIEPLSQSTTEFAIYVAAVGIGVVAGVLLLIRPLTPQRWWASLACGALWLITWYAPILIWMGAMLEFLAVLALIQVFRRPSSTRSASSEAMK